MTGEDGADIEDDGRLLEGERVLGGGFVSEGIEPVVIGAVSYRGCSAASGGSHTRQTRS